MVETSLSRLQKQVTRLEKDNLRLRELLEDRKTKQENAEKSLKYYKENLEKIVNEAVRKATEPLIKEINTLKEENEHLKRILNHDSNNSGIPTSKTKIGGEKRVPNSREKSNLKKGGQKGHAKHKLERFNDEEITDTYSYVVDNPICKACGGKLKYVGKRTKDEFDVEIRLVKRRNEFYEYVCSCCKREVNAPIPLRLKEENQYGSGVQALALSLVNEGFVSFKRTRELISGFTNQELNMSEGYIAKLQKKCYSKLENFDNELQKKLLKEAIIHWDDTTISINGKQACLRFYGNEKIKYYKAHEKKNKEGIDKDGILPFLPQTTVVVHDHNLVNYNDDYDFTNAECCVHLLRDLKELNECLPREWIDKLIKLFIDTNNKRKEYINQNILVFDYEVTDKVIEEYDEIIKEVKNNNLKDFNSYYGNDEKRMIKRLENYKENYLLWILRFDVPFSNNLSERSLRNTKTKMKVSGQFSNIQNAEYFARIKSYIETCKSNDINPHEALKRLIEDNPYTLDEMQIN